MLDRSRDASPLYVQVHRVLAAQIAGGTYLPGAMLPSEPGLAKELDVSRATIIKAFDALERDGLIERRQGRGTFVAAPPKRHSLVDLTSFTAVTAANGSVPSQRWIAYDVIPVGAPRPGLADVFPATQELVRLERVRLSDDIPVGHHVAVVPAELLARAGVSAASENDPTFSLYRALGTIGSQPVSAEESLRAVACPEHIADMLGVGRSIPMMHVRRFSRDRSGDLIEAVEAHYVGSLYEYHTEMVSQSSTEERSSHEDTLERRSGGSLRVVVAERVRGNGSRLRLRDERLS